ncbi:hypothetical protein K9M59_01850 [Candidatus Gracilibacteria bacterium]|nr:hypothetical protein [Candidatus Gracilibacteria bacterium]MCF7819593.1 hypothetical protein [Candidatus Gracilibacteria bacterium]
MIEKDVQSEKNYFSDPREHNNYLRTHELGGENPFLFAVKNIGRKISTKIENTIGEKLYGTFVKPFTQHDD